MHGFRNITGADEGCLFRPKLIITVDWRDKRRTPPASLIRR